MNFFLFILLCVITGLLFCILDALKVINRNIQETNGALDALLKEKRGPKSMRFKGTDLPVGASEVTIDLSKIADLKTENGETIYSFCCMKENQKEDIKI